MALNKDYVDQVTPEQVIKIYAEDGIVLTIEQAEKIIEFMYMLAEISLEIFERKQTEKRSGGSNSNC